jgi:hypothetical protein
MTEFAGCTQRAQAQPTVDDHAPAHPGAEREKEECPLAAAEPKLSLTEGRGAGIVEESYGDI